jgi:hypothetical protein
MGSCRGNQCIGMGMQEGSLADHHHCARAKAIEIARGLVTVPAVEVRPLPWKRRGHNNEMPENNKKHHRGPTERGRKHRMWAGIPEPRCADKAGVGT